MTNTAARLLIVKYYITHHKFNSFLQLSAIKVKLLINLIFLYKSTYENLFKNQIFVF
jgi:hypothetical protein